MDDDTTTKVNLIEILLFTVIYTTCLFPKIV